MHAANHRDATAATFAKQMKKKEEGRRCELLSVEQQLTVMSCLVFSKGKQISAKYQFPGSPPVTPANNDKNNNIVTLQEGTD